LPTGKRLKAKRLSRRLFSQGFCQQAKGLKQKGLAEGSFPKAFCTRSYFPKAFANRQKA
jgi:hypothetical protein